MARSDSPEQVPWDPWHYGHRRMPLEERAKIFMPFDPLKGFRDELRRRELLVERRELGQAASDGEEGFDGFPHDI